MLKGTNILLGITGGIAAYKTYGMIRSIKQQGGEVKVVLTKNGSEFVSKITLGVLSENRVEDSLFPAGKEWEISHLDLARWADVILICPATANSIGKTAGGIADDLLTSVIIASTKPVVFAPAMNVNMFLNPVVQDNIKKLRNLGYHIIGPDEGALACREAGQGRLIDTEYIIDYVKRIRYADKKYTDKKILITAGRTEEEIDPVRVITNRSRGKMGYALARNAYYYGADVILIAGPNSLPDPYGIDIIKVLSSEDMYVHVMKEFKDCDVCIMSAAVLDFKPVEKLKNKLKKKGREKIDISFEKTKDILKEVSMNKGSKILVGFSIETENEIENSLRKLKEKNLDLIVVNNPLMKEAGFGYDTNKVWLIDSAGKAEELPLMSKDEVARIILDRIGHLI